MSNIWDPRRVIPGHRKDEATYVGQMLGPGHASCCHALRLSRDLQRILMEQRRSSFVLIELQKPLEVMAWEKPRVSIQATTWIPM